jgi:CubicO group peptidase (beta-lactamase class C family)
VPKSSGPSVLSAAASALLLAWVCCSGILVAAPASPDGSATDTDELVGLWKAKKIFGPDRGPLEIRRSPSGWTADFLGRRLPITAKGSELSFEVGNEHGAFRGHVIGNAILLHWYSPPSAATWTGYRIATPVRLEAAGPNRWRGFVEPREDEFTLYLPVEKRPDGSIGAYVRNPDRNQGLFWRIEHLVRTGKEIRLMGKRPGSTEETEQMRGTYDPESQVITLNVPGRGGTYDFRRDDDQSDFYPRGKSPGRYSYVPPPALDDGWPTGTLAEVEIDRPAIERFVQKILDMPMDSIAAPQIHGLLVARKGKLVLEEYFHGEHRDRLHDTRSAAKSLTATIVGAAMHAGAPLSLTTRVYDTMNRDGIDKDPDARKKAMTLEHLLTMSSGYYCDDTDEKAPGNEDAMWEQEKEPDSRRYTLRVPMAWAPGEHSVYCSINANLALGLLERVTGESAMDTFERLVAEPMKIRRASWALDRAGNPYGGGSVQLLPRDFLKLGQLMLNEGTWHGRRILSREFVERSVSPLYHLRNVYYGYLWWIYDFPYKNRTVRAYWAGGNGGQSVNVFPELDLVVGTWGGNYGDRVGIHVQQELIPNYVLPAVREPGDDPKAPVVEGKFVTPYGKSDRNGPVEPGRSPAKTGVRRGG